MDEEEDVRVMYDIVVHASILDSSTEISHFIIGLKTISERCNLYVIDNRIESASRARLRA